MTKVLVLYYSMYGHIETMAGAVADGAREVDGVEVTVKRVPELMPREAAEQAGAKLDQAAPRHSPRSSPTTTRSSSARPPASATWPRRCAISGTRPAASGPRVR